MEKHPQPAAIASMEKTLAIHSMCVCVCVCVYMYVCVCVCAYLRAYRWWAAVSDVIQVSWLLTDDKYGKHVRNEELCIGRSVLNILWSCVSLVK